MSKIANLFKNVETLAAAKTLLANADLKSAKLKIGGEPSDEAVASAKLNVTADVKVGGINLEIDLRDVILEIIE